MTVKQQWSIVGGIVAILALGLTIAARSMKDDLYPVNVGSAAPAFRAHSLNGATVKTLADYKGQVVLLNVWATYCEPCKIEMPSLEKLHEMYGDKGLKIIAVEVDHAVSDDSVRKFASTYKLNFEILRDTSGALEKAYQTTGIPETFVIGPEGTIRRKWWGADDWSSQGNRALIAQLLGLPTPRPTNDTVVDTKSPAALRAQ